MAALARSKLLVSLGLGILVLALAGSLAAATAPQPGDRVDLIGARATDVRGNHHRLGILRGTVQPVALVFLDTVCPVATRYMPVLDDLFGHAQANGVSLYGVLSNPSFSWKDGADFADKFGVHFPILMDTAGDLALRLGPKVTAEALVVSTANRLLYRGRINDRHVSIGRARPNVTSRDLRDIIGALGRDQPVQPYETQAVGCFHHVWDSPGNVEVPKTEFTYNRHVAPVVEANCVECHLQGGIAPFSLEGYENSKRWDSMMAHVSAERIMPPWRAEPGFGEFRDVRRLSDRQIELLRSWALAGAPLGDPEDLMPRPAREQSKWRLGEPDMVLQMEPFDVPASGDDIYRYFVLPTGFETDRIVAAFDFSPGDPGVVHHANYLLDTEARARVEDKKDDEPGFAVFGTGNFLDYNAWGIGGWTPGADPWVLDKGRAIWLPQNSDFVLEVHYHLNGRATTDRSEVALYFAREEDVTEYVDGLVIGTQELRIPPGDKNYWRHFWTDVPAGITLTDITPHMHFLGREFIAIATLPGGGEKPLVRIADWDFRWQNTFAYREAVHLPAGSRIDVWVRYDNSTDNPQNPQAVPETVTWGWETNDEMAELWIGFVPDSLSRSKRVKAAADESWYRSADVSAQEIAELLERLPPAQTGGGR